ncbi:MAG: hypothetical protein U0670_05015 [Anaerolineae bacterium]
MRSRRTLLIIIAAVVLLIVVIAGIVIASTRFTPSNEPQYQAAVDFVRAVGLNDNRTALSLLTPGMRLWVSELCSYGQIASCLRAFVPPDWGQFVSVVFRQATPYYTSWDVDMIATYERGDGASGVCIYARIEQMPEGDWRVSRWAGWISCADPRAQDMANNPDTPNRAP